MQYKDEVEYIYNYLLEYYADNDEELLEIIVEESDLDVLIDLILEIRAVPPQAVPIISRLVTQIIENTYRILNNREPNNITELKNYFQRELNFPVPIPSRYDTNSVRVWLNNFRRIANDAVLRENRELLNQLARKLVLDYKVSTSNDWRGIVEI